MDRNVSGETREPVENVRWELGAALVVNTKLLPSTCSSIIPPHVIRFRSRLRLSMMVMSISKMEFSPTLKRKRWWSVSSLFGGIPTIKDVEEEDVVHLVTVGLLLRSGNKMYYRRYTVVEEISLQRMFCFPAFIETCYRRG